MDRLVEPYSRAPKNVFVLEAETGGSEGCAEEAEIKSNTVVVY